MKKVMLVGLPETGKTTFLAALFHMLEDTNLGCVFKLDELPDEMDQLQSYRDTWKKCDMIPRTSGASFSEAILKIKSSTQSFDISIPDNTGEVFSQLLEDRVWQKSIQTQVEESDGILLFVHSVNFKEPMRLDEVQNQIAEFTAHDALTLDGAALTRTAQDPEFKYRSSPTQVLLVDLLQILAEKMANPIRINIVVSAWDLVSTTFQSPEQFLKSKYPLLCQFLDTNKDIFESKICGLSAQGGKYPDESAKLLQIPVSSRVLAVVDDHTSHDITKLLEWFYV